MSMGGSFLTRAKVREATITAVITRADGRVEDLGIISYWNRNPLKRWLGNYLIRLKEQAKHGRTSSK